MKNKEKWLESEEVLNWLKGGCADVIKIEGGWRLTYEEEEPFREARFPTPSFQVALVADGGTFSFTPENTTDVEVKLLGEDEPVMRGLSHLDKVFISRRIDELEGIGLTVYEGMMFSTDGIKEGVKENVEEILATNEISCRPLFMNQDKAYYQFIKQGFEL